MSGCGVRGIESQETKEKEEGGIRALRVSLTGDCSSRGVSGFRSTNRETAPMGL